MKQTKSMIAKDGSGTVTLIPEEPEDMWHAYNLIQPTDLLRAPAVRRVQSESAAGSVRSERVHTMLTIRVTKTDYSASDSKLAVSGKVSEQNNIVALGSFHTLDLELNRAFTLEKSEGWDSVAKAQLRDALESAKEGAMLWAVMLQEGVANICYVTEFQTKLVQHVTSPIPKKRATGSDHDKAVKRFHALLWETLGRQLQLQNTSPENIPPVLLASPGFTAQNFLEYVREQAVSTGSKTTAALVKKITLTHASSANLQSLAEVMKSKAITSQLHATKFARETQLLDNFYASLRRDDGKAWYGPKEVVKCVEKGAVGRGGGVLLISNNLFRNQDVQTRKRWVALVDQVRDVEGGEVRVLSEAHESGRRLEALGGVAALLSYPIFDLEEDEEEEAVGNGDGGQTASS